MEDHGEFVGFGRGKFDIVGHDGGFRLLRGSTRSRLIYFWLLE